MSPSDSSQHLAQQESKLAQHRSSEVGEPLKQPERLSVQQLQRLTQDTAHLPPHEREQVVDNLPDVHQKQLAQHLKLLMVKREVQSDKNKSELEAIVTKYQEINASRGITDVDRFEYTKEMQQAYSTEHTKVRQHYLGKVSEIDDAYGVSSENPEEGRMSEGDYLSTVNRLRDQSNKEQTVAKVIEEYAKLKLKDLAKEASDT
jgi:hypothetical protein